MGSRLHIETTYYGGCSHCCILSSLQQLGEEYSVQVDRYGDKKDRKNRYRLSFDEDFSEETVEQKCREIIRSGPIQQWSMNWTSFRNR